MTIRRYAYRDAGISGAKPAKEDDMIANILILLSILIALPPTLDLLFSEAQKTAISDATLRLWNFLDDLKGQSFIDWLNHPSVQAGFTIGALSLSTWLVLILIGDDIGAFGFTRTVTFVVLSNTLGVWIGTRLSSRMIRAPSLKAIVVRTTYSFLLTLAPFALSGLAALLLAGDDTLGFAIIFILLSLLFLPVCTTTLIFWAGAAIPLTVGGALRGALLASEYTVRRLAEYPKGPIIAFGVLVGGIAGIMKAFT